MKKLKLIIEFNWIILLSVAIFTHFVKIMYLIFKFNFLKKYEIFTNKNISDFQLGMYYVLTILVLINVVLKKLNILY